MREGWEVKTLGEVVKYDKTKFTEDKAPYIGMENIQSNTRKLEIDPLVEGDKSSTFTYGKTHVLYGRLRPYLNKVYAPDHDGHCSTEIFPLRPNPKSLDRDYLAYWLSSDMIVEAINATCTGARMPRANMNAVLNFPIPLPPLSVQREIVEHLDAAFELIDRARANVERCVGLAGEVWEGVLEEKLTTLREQFGVTELRNLAKAVQYGTSSKSLRSGEVPVLRMGNIQNGKIDWTDLKFSSNTSDIEKYKLNIGDVLFNRTNSPEHVGKSALFDDTRHAIFAGYLIRIKVNQLHCDPEFLTLVLNAKSSRKYGYAVMSSSVNQANINASKLKSYEIPNADLETQGRTAQSLKLHAELVDQAIANYMVQINMINDLRASLLEDAFSNLDS